MNRGWAIYVNEEGEYHIVPQGEHHRCDAECWCEPTRNDEPPGERWVHHSFDRREERERP